MNRVDLAKSLLQTYDVTELIFNNDYNPNFVKNLPEKEFVEAEFITKYPNIDYTNKNIDKYLYNNIIVDNQLHINNDFFCKDKDKEKVFKIGIKSRQPLRIKWEDFINNNEVA